MRILYSAATDSQENYYHIIESGIVIFISNHSMEELHRLIQYIINNNVNKRLTPPHPKLPLGLLHESTGFLSEGKSLAKIIGTSSPRTYYSVYKRGYAPYAPQT